MKRKIIVTSILLGLFVIPSFDAFASTLTHIGNKTSVTTKMETLVQSESNNVDIPKTKVNLKEKATSQTFWVTNSLNLRSGAGAGYKRILTIPKNKEVKAIAKASNGWYKVQYSGKSGYVSGKYLTTKKIVPQKQVTSAKKYAPLTIYFPNKTVSFKNGGRAKGQSIIDKNTKIASTWGGAETFSGSDGKNTHIIAHNPGAFNGIWSYGIGEKVIIVDHNGNKTTYSISEKFIVDNRANRVDNKESLYDYITSTEGGEVVTFQTCKNSGGNWIIRAVKVN